MDILVWIIILIVVALTIGWLVRGVVDTKIDKHIENTTPKEEQS